MDFRILLTIHILAAVVFLGNIITAAFWKVRADRSGNLEAMAATARSVSLADWFFTLPGLVGLLATGFIMAGMTSWQRFQEPWLGGSLVLLVITGLIWAGLLMPLQRRMARLAAESVQQGALDTAYTRASKKWAVLGGIASLLPVIILFLMVLKPGI